MSLYRITEDIVLKKVKSYKVEAGSMEEALKLHEEDQSELETERLVLLPREVPMIHIEEVA